MDLYKDRVLFLVKTIPLKDAPCYEDIQECQDFLIKWMDSYLKKIKKDYEYVDHEIIYRPKFCDKPCDMSIKVYFKEVP